MVQFNYTFLFNIIMYIMHMTMCYNLLYIYLFINGNNRIQHHIQRNY